MSDKLVSQEVKTVLAAVMMSFVIFRNTVLEKVSEYTPEFQDSEFVILGRQENKHQTAMNELDNTCNTHKVADLTVNGCLAILLDLSKVVQINVQTCEMLGLNITYMQEPIMSLLDQTMMVALSEQ